MFIADTVRLSHGRIKTLLRRSSRRLGVTLFAVAGIGSTGTAHGSQRADGAAMPVRYTEGAVHEFLELRDATGGFLADGELTRVAADSGMESRMVFHFSNSVFEETVRFTQRGVFTMQEFHLLQSGPAFAEDIDATLSRSGAYAATSTSHANGEVQTVTGTLDLPVDVYNGMAITIAKNLPAGTAETVHFVAFSPEPHIIRLELAPQGSESVLIGGHESTVTHIVLKPRLGALLGFFARLKGKAATDGHLYIVTDSVPAFVRYQGPMYYGPVWRLGHPEPAAVQQTASLR